MDMPATIESLVQAANTTPLSIVIIGVGPADFSSMNALDGDGKVLRDSCGRVSTRDMLVATFIMLDATHILPFVRDT